ncbi:MAG: T9SS type B sorting domain-containing protein [Saprospiraceae bacterium]|nr:T9SS type B sorting domain-containing protein [Saprospiraceae bacterium]
MIITVSAQREYLHVFDNIDVNYQHFGYAKMASWPDGGWVVAECDSATHVVRVIHFDACGDLSWAKTLTYPLSFRPYRVSDVIVDSAGQILLGTMHFGGNQSAFHLVRLDREGEIIWARAWGATDFGPGVFKMGLLPENRIFIVGWCNPIGVVSDMIGILNEDGDLLSLRRYYTSAIGYLTVAIPLRNGHILMRRGDRLYEVDTDSGQVVWQTWQIAPLYNSVVPVQLDSGFLLLGQFANSKDRYSAVPVFVDDQGKFLSRGDMFRANGGAFSNVENLQIRRVEPLPNGHFVTVTTDSLNKGYMSAVVFDEQGSLVKQIYVNPDPDQYRLLNHDFCLLPNGQLAIAANLNGKLAMVSLDLDEPNLCGAKTVLQPIPYSTSVYDAELPMQPAEYVLQEVVIDVSANDFDPGWQSICDDPLMLPDRDTLLSGCPSDTLWADASFPGATAWSWEGGETIASIPLLVGQEGRVRVLVGCQFFNYTFRTQEKKDCPCPVDFPNVFTPNGDGVNDLFGPVATCPIETYQLQVYSRWGKLVYQSADPQNGWDGKYRDEALPSDCYGYHAEYRTTGMAGTRIIRGEITLVR